FRVRTLCQSLAADAEGHSAVPTLRSTNITGYDSTVSGITFDPDLGRASYVLKKSGDSVHVRRFTADTLAAMVRRRRMTSSASRRILQSAILLVGSVVSMAC